ncbi:hypothetical protein, partial [Rhizobium halophytocola]|uniref:hypothetical protein n=1 Tax=Rhizobium halophytocola TaxID=735519 RepID=UPI003606DE8B
GASFLWGLGWWSAVDARLGGQVLAACGEEESVAMVRPPGVMRWLGKGQHLDPTMLSLMNAISRAERERVRRGSVPACGETIPAASGERGKIAVTEIFRF